VQPLRIFMRAALVGACACLICLIDARSAPADYRDLMGFPELQTLLGGALPDGSGIAKVTLVEGTDGNGDYMPSAHSELNTKTFTNVTSAAGVTQASGGSSNHATFVARNYVGKVVNPPRGSIAPGLSSIDVYEANHWMGLEHDGSQYTAATLSGFLDVPFSVTPNPPGDPIIGVNTVGAELPDTTDSRIVNHSWIAEFSSAAVNGDALRRYDFTVEQDDLIQVAGLPNNANADASLWKNAYNGISVGLTNGLHRDGTRPVDSVYTSGRVAPTVVAHGHRPDGLSYFTSWATPQVSAWVALHLEVASSNPGLSNGAYTVRSRTPEHEMTINHAEASEVVKATLMAGADRYVMQRGPSLTTYSADTTNNLDGDFGAGQMNVFNSYLILAAGESDSVEDGGGPVENYGWDYDPSFGGLDGSNATATYGFTAGTGPEQLFATLAWNIDIEDGDLVTAGFQPEATLYDLDLQLFDVTGIDELVAASVSDIHNTENIVFDVTAGRDYQLRVIKGQEADFNWDYALAWRVSGVAIPEPCSLLLMIVAFALLQRGFRRR